MLPPPVFGVAQQRTFVPTPFSATLDDAACHGRVTTAAVAAGPNQCAHGRRWPREPLRTYGTDCPQESVSAGPDHGSAAPPAATCSKAARRVANVSSKVATCSASASISRCCEATVVR